MAKPARFERDVDGDTYVLRVARYGSFEKRAGIDHFRLAGWGARELHGSDSGAEYANDGTLIRISGQDAAHLATTLLQAASLIEVDELAIDSFGRVIADIWLDGQPLGHLLAEQHAVIPGHTMGIDGPVRSRIAPP